MQRYGKLIDYNKKTSLNETNDLSLNDNIENSLSKLFPLKIF